jgi:hydroxymethylbilane synthase
MPTGITLTLATRQSPLALWQAQYVAHELEKQGCQVVLLPMSTQGDRLLDRPLFEVGGKGLFIKELEHALQSKKADIAVHSLKDVPVVLPEGFALAAVMEREDPRDAWVSTRYAHWSALPSQAHIGTASLRRRAFLQKQGPDWHITPLRGNLQTRLAQLDNGLFDGIVLAAAGLKRLGLASRITALFDVQDMLPAPGQAALGLEICADRTDLISLLAPLNHPPTLIATTAERALSAAMGGNCALPLAAFAHWDASDSSIHLQAAWAPTDAQGLPIAPLLECELREKMGLSDLETATRLGHALAHVLKDRLVA